MILHSPYGLRVHGPLALAVSRRLRERYGIDEKPTASDDGIIVRLPDTEDDSARAPTCSCSTPTRSSRSSPPRWAARRCSRRGSANARPARCCCRAGIPASARRCGISGSAPHSCSTSPASTRTSRSCWRRSANACRTSTTCPTLIELMTRHRAAPGAAWSRSRPPTPSPFAASLLFGYVGAFMYEGDSPLAERRAAALSLDSTLLAELLGRVELRELLDPTSSRPPTRQLQHLTRRPGRPRRRGRRRSAAAAGPADRGTRSPTLHDGADVGGWLDGLRAAKRALTVSFAGPDVVGGRRGHRPAARRRRGGGAGRGARQPSPKRSPIRSASCCGRYARTHGPFTTADAAARFGLGLRVAGDVLGRLAVDGRLIRGEFTDSTSAVCRLPPAGDQWCDAEVLRILRRRSLAALRAQVEPVSTAAYGRFLPSWQQVGRAQLGHRRPGRRHRSAGRSTDSGLGGRAAGVRAAGARLPTRDARRTAGLRRGHLVGRGPDRGGWRRLDRVPPRRVRAVDAGPADGDRVHRHPSSDHGHARRRRGLLLPSARRRRSRTVQSRRCGN